MELETESEIGVGFAYSQNMRKGLDICDHIVSTTLTLEKDTLDKLKTNVALILYYTVDRDVCNYCGYGDSRTYLFQTVEGWYGLLMYNDGCLTYDPEATVRIEVTIDTFKSEDVLENYFNGARQNEYANYESDDWDRYVVEPEPPLDPQWESYYHDVIFHLDGID